MSVLLMRLPHTRTPTSIISYFTRLQNGVLLLVIIFLLLFPPPTHTGDVRIDVHPFHFRRPFLAGPRPELDMCTSSLQMLKQSPAPVAVMQFAAIDDTVKKVQMLKQSPAPATVMPFAAIDDTVKKEAPTTIDT